MLNQGVSAFLKFIDVENRNVEFEEISKDLTNIQPNLLMPDLNLKSIVDINYSISTPASKSIESFPISSISSEIVNAFNDQFLNKVSTRWSVSSNFTDLNE